MRRKLVTVILAAAMSASLLAGCGTKAESVVSESVEETEVTSESTEAECEHEWVDATCQEAKHCSKCGKTEGTPLDHEWVEATFAAPKTCTLCGETEGEREQSYFEEHGVEVPDAPVSCTVDALNYNGDNPEEYQMATDGTWEQIDCYAEPAEDDGYQLVCLELCVTSLNHYYATQDIYYDCSRNFMNIFDWYTGRMFPSHDLSENSGAFDYSTTLEIDGLSYDVSYTKEMQWEFGDFTYADNGDATKPVKCYYTITFKVPIGYDGLVFAAIPEGEYTELNTETFNGVEEAIYAPLDESDEDYVEGIKYFRINRSDDSAIMTGANATSSAASGDTSDGAVIDDSREQGSIGESGLPYYKIGFSPKDFAIGGLSIYDDKSLDEMYEAVDLQDAGFSVGDNVVWLKKNDELNDEIVFSLHQPGHMYGLAYYSNDAEDVKMFFSSIEEQNIATADFIQSPVIPGETTFAEAVDALGIRDVIAAMGVQGDAFKDASLDFESQFSEDTHAYIIWGDDNRNLVVYWMDRDGKEVRLTLIGKGDVVDSLSISREN